MKHERYVWLGVVAGAGLLLYTCDASANRRYGALDSEAKRLRADSVRLVAHANSIAVRLRVETVTVNRTRTQWRTLVDSVLRFDTVQLTRRETLLVARADTAIKACTDALGTCSELVRAKDRLLANRDSALQVEIARRPSIFDKTRNALAFIAAGYFLHLATAR